MSEHALSGGGLVRIRPVTADDAAALRDAWKRLSPMSRHRRFFGSVTALTDEMVRYLTDVDGKNHIALAAVIDSPDLKTETGVGIARCIRLKDEPEVAEAAVTVVDDMQGKGVGRLLLQELAKAACAVGIRRFRGEGLADNAPLRSLLSDLGIAPHRTDEGTFVFDVDISDVASSSDSPVRRWLRAAVSSLESLATLPSFPGIGLPWSGRPDEDDPKGSKEE